jgi:hypothetical protein
MPRISAFYGIVITMYFNDHSPPHFHAIYGEWEAQVSIPTGEIFGGRLPPRARRLVEEWRRLHRVELLQEWAKAQSGLPLDRIAPLP